MQVNDRNTGAVCQMLFCETTQELVRPDLKMTAIKKSLRVRVLAMRHSVLQPGATMAETVPEDFQLS